MRQDEQHRFIDRFFSDRMDGIVDAIAAVVIILCLVTMAVFWVSAQ